MIGTRTFLASLAIIPATAALAFAAPATAQNISACAPQETLAEKLGQEFGEAVTAQGVDGQGNLLQVYTSENGTWTIAVTLPGGPSCIVSSGDGWNASQLATAPAASKPDYAS